MWNSLYRLCPKFYSFFFWKADIEGLPMMGNSVGGKTASFFFWKADIEGLPMGNSVGGRTASFFFWKADIEGLRAALGKKTAENSKTGSMSLSKE